MTSAEHNKKCELITGNENNCIHVIMRWYHQVSIKQSKFCSVRTISEKGKCMPNLQSILIKNKLWSELPLMHLTIVIKDIICATHELPPHAWRHSRTKAQIAMWLFTQNKSILLNQNSIFMATTTTVCTAHTQMCLKP